MQNFISTCIFLIRLSSISTTVHYVYWFSYSSPLHSIFFSGLVTISLLRSILIAFQTTTAASVGQLDLLCLIFYAWAFMLDLLCMSLYAWSFMHKPLCLIFYAWAFMLDLLCMSLYVWSFMHELLCLSLYAWAFMLEPLCLIFYAWAFRSLMNLMKSVRLFCT